MAEKLEPSSYLIKDPLVIEHRVSLLRKKMKDELHCDALIVPTADPHGSEYLSDHWKCRAWITGFSGSAGTAVVTRTKAAVWTDSRYWIQAEEELKDTPFVLMKEGYQQTPTIEKWLEEDWNTSSRKTNPTLGVLGKLTSYEEYEQWKAVFGNRVTIKVIEQDIFDVLWTNRPALSLSPIRLHSLTWAGESYQEKIKRIGQYYMEKGIEGCLVSELSEIAWTLNLRGEDIAYNPVFMSYLLLDFEGNSILCVDKRKLTPEINHYLTHIGITVCDYDAIERVIDEYLQNEKSLALSSELPISLVLMAQQRAKTEDRVHILPSPITGFKAIKNEAELAGFRKAMEKDGVAMVRFLRELNEKVALGNFTEIDVDEWLTALRQENEGFISLSFGTIAAYGAHGAIVHYEADAQTNAILEKHGLLLLDSGVQYEEGTTDITRTIPLGNLTAEEKKIYTLVLKGHLGLSCMRFPEGTTGLALDMSARKDMWAAGYDFGHGTGHGVGAGLCVHEGPHQIRKNVRPCTLVGFMPGMTITNEPGIYLAGKFGVRIENTLCVVADGENEFGRWCRFENLTLCPIDRKAIDFSMMTKKELDILNTYHKEVRRRLLPLLPTKEDQDFLIKETEPIAASVLVG